MPSLEELMRMGAAGDQLAAKQLEAARNAPMSWGREGFTDYMNSKSAIQEERNRRAMQGAQQDMARMAAKEQDRNIPLGTRPGSPWYKAPPPESITIPPQGPNGPQPIGAPGAGARMEIGTPEKRASVVEKIKQRAAEQQQLKQMQGQARMENVGNAPASPTTFTPQASTNGMGQPSFGTPVTAEFMKTRAWANDNMMQGVKPHVRPLNFREKMLNRQFDASQQQQGAENQMNQQGLDMDQQKLNMLMKQTGIDDNADDREAYETVERKFNIERALALAELEKYSKMYETTDDEKSLEIIEKKRDEAEERVREISIKMANMGTPTGFAKREREKREEEIKEAERIADRQRRVATKPRVKRDIPGMPGDEEYRIGDRAFEKMFGKRPERKLPRNVPGYQVKEGKIQYGQN